jgi:hypothetical protein
MAKLEEGQVGVLEGHAVEEVDSHAVVEMDVDEVVHEQEGEGAVKDEVKAVVEVVDNNVVLQGRARVDEQFARAEFIRNNNLALTESTAMYTSTCPGCIYPAVCRRCGVRGENSIFLCIGCSLPVPKDLHSCDVCGNPLLCDKYWCKDCATTVGLDKDGVCICCNRNPSNYVDAKQNVEFVPDTQA